MTEEYEEPDYDANETNAEAALPAGVVERLTKYAERTKRPYDEVLAEWRAYIAKEFSCDHPEDEDEDLLVDWTEMMLVETRAASGGGVSWLLQQDVLYSSGILNLNYSIGTPAPSTWATWVILTEPTVQLIPAWAIAIPPLNPPFSLPLSTPFRSARLAWLCGLVVVG